MDTREQAIYNEVTAFDDPLDRYGVIIEFGEELPPMDQAAKTDDNIVKGCQSTVWLDVQCRDEHIVLQADSNTAITKGIIAMLVRVLDGLSPAEVFFGRRLDLAMDISMRAHADEEVEENRCQPLYSPSS